MFVRFHAIAAVCVYLLACPFPAVSSETEAREWIARMVAAAKRISFQGSFVYDNGQGLTTMRIVQFAEGGRETQELEVLNGEYRGLMRSGDDLLIYSEDGQPVNYDRFHKAPFARVLPDDLQQLEASYRLTLENPDRVAGRACQTLSITARDEFRYSYRVWLDLETAMLLQFDLLDSEGQVLEKLLFTEVGIGVSSLANAPPVPESASRRPSPVSGGMLDAGPLSEDEWRWRADELPPGFRKIAHMWHGPDKRGMHAEHLMFSDGLASVSAYIEPQADDTMRGHSRIGPVNAWADAVAGHQIVVVGDVPMRAIEMIGAGLTPVER